MPFIAFLGCDGSGKSTVIDRLEARLRADGAAVTRGHWRPAPLDRGRPGGSASDPHGGKPRGLASSVAKLGWLWISWWIGWWKGLRVRARGGYVLFDRYHADLLVDPLRYRYGGPSALARLASATMPQPDRVVFLDADEEVLLARKREVPAEALARSRDRYLELCRSHPRFRVVDAGAPLEEVLNEVAAVVGDA